MKILAIDIGAGTQDILFYNTEKELENSIKLVLPSPPVIIVDKIKKQTNLGNNLYFDGTIMGGGKIKGAILAHIGAGYEVVMEENSARTIKDDLKVVENLGIEIVEEDSYIYSPKYSNYSKITLRDINIDELSSIISQFDINFNFDEIAVAAQDHGFSEKMGDRDFRFEKIRERLSEPLAVEEFAFNGNIPDYFSRMKAIEKSLEGFNPILMDSKFASVCGASMDPEVAKLNSYVVMDIGNGHTMAASIEDGKIQGVFEHHTSSLTPEKIENLIEKLVQGTITHEEVHKDNGHGAHVINPISKVEKVVVTGPRRNIIEQTKLDYYNASPGGDVMMTGPVGLIKAVEYLK
ncbi:DUF1786 domain-containing protein [Methanobrevibacter sp. TMH8]|uniref:DUF1786 domain-containing protein n=1 Tax=Methanobrevibacter sp. TMH8 TaxID=2848611 RepID=UPI001CC9B9CF|nr:DUF1786 domain-containing protein [Methanobrevibacter sp. TMH8]MBZ9570385.1 DUF1786 domain-containing protein [Methanobrevibacter sp. TMH8]